MIDKGSVDSKEQDMGTSVDNTCYEKLQSKFWWLVWQERVHIVAMVTNTVERGQQKCEHYWPDEGTKEYGPFKVTLRDQQVFADYTIRQFFVSVSLRNWKYMLQLFN